MRLAVAMLLACLAVFAAPAFAADVKPYVDDDMVSNVVRLTETLRKETDAAPGYLKLKSTDQMRKQIASNVSGSTFKVAMTLAGELITADPKNADSWLLLTSVAARSDDAKADNRYDNLDRGATAAYAAFQLDTTPSTQADALAALGDIYRRQEAWRPSLNAYLASLQRKDKEDVRATYEDLRTKYGFRILDYKVDNDSASPRVCFNFSDPIALKTDFTPFVAVSGASSTSISTEEQQICVEGLKHGERYAIVLREGLPSNVGENLLKSADYDIYVQDRSPQAHFAGKAYVLPRQGQLGRRSPPSTPQKSRSTSTASATATC